MAFQIALSATLSDVIKAVMGIMRGEQNNSGFFTLTPGTTSTVFQFVNSAPGKIVTFSPSTANAAAALATTFIPPALVKKGQFTITHANNAQADRTFAFEVTGGG